MNKTVCVFTVCMAISILSCNHFKEYDAESLPDEARLEHNNLMLHVGPLPEGSFQP